MGEGGARGSGSLWSSSLVGDPPLPSNAVLIKTGFKAFKETFPIFQGLHLVQKRALSLSFLVLPQHEQFYPEGLFQFAPFRHLRICVG